MMAGIGDLVVNLVARTQQFTRPINASVGVLAKVGPAADNSLTRIAESSARVGNAATIAAGGLSATALSATALATVVPGMSGAAVALQGLTGAAWTAARAGHNTSTIFSGLGANATPIQRLSQVIGKVGAAASLANLALWGTSAVMQRLGYDTSRIDALRGTLWNVTKAAAAARLAIWGAGLATRTFTAVATAPVRASRAVWSGLNRTVFATSLLLRGVSSTARSAVASLAMVAPAAGPLAILLGPAAIAGAMAIAAGQSVVLASSLETNATAFETLLGSADAAQKHLTEMQQFAAKTPFGFSETVDASRRLMALGFAADQSIPVLRIVGDAVGSLGLGSQGIDRITLALGQMQSKGKVSAQEINQLAEAGIPAWAMIADKIGVSIPEAMKMAENGAISSGTGINAVLAGMQAKFGGGMEKQAATLAGQWSQLKDQVSLVMTDIGQALIEGFSLKAVIGSTTSFVERFRSEWMPSVRSGIASVAEVVHGFAILASEAWNGWLGESVGLLADFVMNFDLHWQIAYQNIVLWASNSLASFTNFFTNAGQLLVWFGSNFFNIIYDAGNAYITVWMNVGRNLRDIWAGVLSFISGNGFQFNATPLLDGFKSSVSELPEFTKAAIAETTPELESLYQQLADRYTQTATASAPAIAAAAEAAFKPLSEDSMTNAAGGKGKSGQKNKDAGFSEALSRGSSEAVAALQRGQFASGAVTIKDVAANTKKQLAEAVKQTQLLASVAASVGAPIPNTVVGW